MLLNLVVTKLPSLDPFREIDNVFGIDSLPAELDGIDINAVEYTLSPNSNANKDNLLSDSDADSSEWE